MVRDLLRERNSSHGTIELRPMASMMRTCLDPDIFALRLHGARTNNDCCIFTALQTGKLLLRDLPVDQNCSCLLKQDTDRQSRISCVPEAENVSKISSTLLMSGHHSGGIKIDPRDRQSHQRMACNSTIWTTTVQPKASCTCSSVGQHGSWVAS